MAQINIIFTIITLITSVLFVVIFRQTMDSVSKRQAERDFLEFSKELSETERGTILYSQYYAYVAYLVDSEFKNPEIERVELGDEKDFITLEEVNKFYYEKLHLIENNIDSHKIIRENNLNFYYSIVTADEQKFVIITISDNSFQMSLNEPVNNIVLIGFLSLIILGNAIILLWTNITVERIKNLKKEVLALSESSYKNPISIEGYDELTDLSTSVEIMRKEIVNHEQMKQEMLQNLSHDIKTPISVIKSYSEAIKDGISDVDDIDVIIRQTDVLASKVVKLLEWNRLEYIEEKQTYYPVHLRRLITSVANNYKYKQNIDFILDLDNSYIEGLDDYFETMISNIIENALRYAETKIIITLKNKKITIYNDGDPIDEKFLNNDFRPYQKGHKGNFGLGMSIVAKTAELFNLRVYVENINNGVRFTIEPL